MTRKRHLNWMDQWFLSMLRNIPPSIIGLRTSSTGQIDQWYISDILKVKADAIVNPGNSYGLMGGGVANIIKLAGGKDIEKEAVALAPIEVGEAVMTNPGKLNLKGIIHATTMKKPSMKIPVENVFLATTAALKCADDNSISIIAFPGMGTGVGGVSYKEAANAMLKAIIEFDMSYTTILSMVV